MQSPAPRALVTAGGTREPVDDVRVLTNLSTGRFGAAIANALAARGVAVTLLGSRELFGGATRIDPRVRRVPFGSFAELATALEETIAAERPRAVFMAAAVADYSPAATAGKLASSDDELILRLRRNPKLLQRLRGWCGDEATLVGFKLLSGVPRAELVAVARAQARAARLDLTVANDLAELGPEQHPVILVPAGPGRAAPPPAGEEGPEGDDATERLEGRREAVAEALVARVLARAPALRPASGAAARTAAAAEAAELSAWLRDALPGLQGGVRPDPIDPGLLAAVPALGGLLALEGTAGCGADGGAGGGADGLWVLPDAELEPAPAPGALPTPGELVLALGRAALEGRYAGGAFALDLSAGSGSAGRVLLGLEPGGAARLRREWRAVRAALEAQVAGQDAGLAAALRAARLAPALAGARAVGAVAALPLDVAAEAGLPGAACRALFVRPDARGHGHGEALLERLDAAGCTIALPRDDEAALAYCVARGHFVVAERDPWLLLGSAARRSDLRPAASVCLVDPIGRRVLVGLRRSEPQRGRWAFPGGRCDPGEDALATALRELAEETGIALPAGARPLFVAGVRTASGRGELGHAIACHVLLTLDPPAPRPSAELEASWLPLAEARALRPMTPGTRRVLRRLAHL